MTVMNGGGGQNWLGVSHRLTGPFDLPLWFLRDLIVVVIFTPVIYITIKKLKAVVIAILFMAYISGIWPMLPGLSITAFFFFTTGAYFAINQYNIIEFTNKYKYFFVSISIILLVFSTLFYGSKTIIGQSFLSLFTCTGVFTAFFLASNAITKYHIEPNRFIVSSCFFIYALHAMPFSFIGSLLSITKQSMHALIPGESIIEETICYLASPVFTSAICIICLVLARRIIPKTTLLFSGNK